MRLIDADALMENVQFRLPIDNKNGEIIDGCVRITRRIIENAPTIDAEPVRHGCWFPYRVAGEPLLRFQCSVCHHWVDGGTDRNYCPNCGAKMGGAEDD